ncbi:MAG: tyrosine-type recombinase/integrase [Gammaproteobacteria bacterium]
MHIQWGKDGIEIFLPSSKTDQEHEGQYCAIPYGNELLCPVKELQIWLDSSKITTGAIFRRIMYNKMVAGTALTPLTVNHIVKRCARAATLTNADQLSPHSLRRGLATSAARTNSSLHVIMRAGRWKQVNTVMEYIEASERFTDNAALRILQNIKETAMDK